MARGFRAFCAGSSAVERQPFPRNGLEGGGSIPPPRAFGPIAQWQSNGRNDPGVAGSIPARPSKMFAIGRRDLPAGLRMAQMCHALRYYAEAFPYIEADWFRHSNTLVLLEVEDIDQLRALAVRARAHGSSLVEFSEPDMEDEGVTALALGPEAERLVSSLPLALKKS